MTNEEFQKLVLEKLTSIDQRQSTMEQELSSVKKSLVKLENEQGLKVSALFDAREVQFDTNERIFNTLNRIESKVDRMSFKSFNSYSKEQTDNKQV